MPSPAAASSVVPSRLLLTSWGPALWHERIHESHRVTQKPAMQLDKADSKIKENSLTVVHQRANEQRDVNNPKSHKPPMEGQGFAVPLSQSGRQGLRLAVSADTAPTPILDTWTWQVTFGSVAGVLISCGPTPVSDEHHLFKIPAGREGKKPY